MKAPGRVCVPCTLGGAAVVALVAAGLWKVINRLRRKIG
jgi:hypothetical protein